MNSGWRGNYLRYKSYFLNVLANYKQRQDIKVYLEILLTSATISIFAIFAIRPTLVTIADLYKEIQTKEETVAMLDKKIDSLEKAQVEVAANQAQLDLLDVAIPDKPRPEVFARQIEGLSSKDQSAIDSLTIDTTELKGLPVDQKRKSKEAKLPEGASGVPITINTTGDFSPLFNFLKDVENLRRPIVFSNINFRHSATYTQSPLQLIISGDLPYFVASNKAQTIQQ